jgi:hypothetical protein
MSAKESWSGPRRLDRDNPAPGDVDVKGGAAALLINVEVEQHHSCCGFDVAPGAQLEAFDVVV